MRRSMKRKRHRRRNGKERSFVQTISNTMFTSTSLFDPTSEMLE
jgi:hypothetical protein